MTCWGNSGEALKGVWPFIKQSVPPGYTPDISDALGNVPSEARQEA